MERDIGRDSVFQFLEYLNRNEYRVIGIGYLETIRKSRLLRHVSDLQSGTVDPCYFACLYLPATTCIAFGSTMS